MPHIGDIIWLVISGVVMFFAIRSERGFWISMWLLTVYGTVITGRNAYDDNLPATIFTGIVSIGIAIILLIHHQPPKDTTH